MSKFGERNLDVIVRRALLDALEVLEPHLTTLILVGAQAVYTHTNHIELAAAPTTSDADIVLDTRLLAITPELSGLLRFAGYFENPDAKNSPGQWVNREGVPLDLLQPQVLSSRPPGRRAAHIDPHARGSLRIGYGLDAVLVDNRTKTINSFDAQDDRKFQIKVAGPASLIVAKMAKIADRIDEVGDKSPQKDALDVYRLLLSSESAELATSMRILINDELCSKEVKQGVETLEKLFSESLDSPGNNLVVEATRGIEDAETIRASMWALSTELLEML